MEAELGIWIRQAEDRWLDLLYSNAKRLFRSNTLPSHDHTHHMRVWNLSKTLLREIATFNSGIERSLVEGVLVAAFFHDLGMVSSTREDHGRLSREYCEQWFRDSGCKHPGRFEEILRAIELHDRKEEKIYESFEPGRTPEILAILSVADDLEALGTIGIYRYAEIYLRRDIPLKELGRRVLSNASRRFQKLEIACGLCADLLDRFREEYIELCEFYEQYQAQVEQVPLAEDARSGPLGVINCIRTGDMLTDQQGKELNEYLRKLDHELVQARL